MEGDLLSEEEELREQSEDLDLRCTSVHQGWSSWLYVKTEYTAVVHQVEYTAVHQREHRIAEGDRIYTLVRLGKVHSSASG
jgi:hypothetical protein